MTNSHEDKIVEAEKILASWVEDAVERAKNYPIKKWKPGEKLKILFVGYNGKRNTGSDVRVASMVEQFYRLLGRDKIEISITTFDPEKTKVYFSEDTKFVHLVISPTIFEDVMKAIAEHHMTVISEGSTLKSSWSNSLTLFFANAMGASKVMEKPCIAYGSGAGKMDDWLLDTIKPYIDKTYFLCREFNSLKIVRELGLEADGGVDTAWPFPPAKREWAEQELREKAGWDGKKPILGVAVINPFCWPVRPDFEKWQSGYQDEHPDEWYEGFMFFTASKERKILYHKYLGAIAYAVDNFAYRHNMHVIIFGMEALDQDAVTKLQDLLRTPAYIFSSNDYDGYQLTALLWRLSMLVTSRYHARVLTMPAGIPAIAISMDERLYNLLVELGQLHNCYLAVDDPELDVKLPQVMENVWRDRVKIGEEMIKKIPFYLRSMASMGARLRDFVRFHFPDFPLPPTPDTWLDFVPQLYPELKQIVEKYDKSEESEIMGRRYV